ncbi:gamma-glutamyl-gamma-aminobutyrate hydrolase family protein [Parabacteroides sp. OttesenSCG-928-N08]|nr:gamma-glutamyl-gamma-aminobutyrate hydrolase family protein [Parabacteroides sp. OttesenSCG-928-N08]
MHHTFPLSGIETLFEEVDRFSPAQGKPLPPRIGISANRKEGMSCIAETYVNALLRAGCAPVLIPVMSDLAALTTIVESLDGLLMSGGGDINPLLVNEEPIPQLQDIDTLRDQYDFILIRLAANRQLPMMGICRGLQLINIAFGGSIYQDIYSQASGELLKHSQKMPREQASHTVYIEPEISSSLFEGVEQKLYVNSFHHQAIDRAAPEFIVTGRSSDGLIEAIEHREKPIFGVQWHPEAMTPVESDLATTRLFEALREAALRFSEAKAIHNEFLTIDSHTDTPMLFPGAFDLGERQGGKVNLPMMEEGKMDAAFMVAYIPQGERDESSLQAATRYAIERLERVKQQEQLHPQRVGIAYTPQDLLRLKQQQKKALFLGIENGYAIGQSLDNINLFKEMGVSYITLCHNGDNDICDSARGEGEWGGISPFGKAVVERMNQLGIMIDLSHASEKSFYDALKYSKTPIIASHSSCRALCDHPRNLSDDQIKALAAHNGVMQICLYKGFLNKEEEKASLSDIISHILHVVDLVGVDYVGIGSDFDGDGEVIGCRATNELIHITVRLLESKRFTPDDIRKIWGGNLLRVMTAVQSAAD